MKRFHIHMLLLCCAILCVIWYLSYVTEGFETVDAAVCGTAGIKPSAAAITYFKLKTGKDVSSMRLYTKSECNKLEKGTYKDLLCGNGPLNYSEKCAGLNGSFPTPAPNECKVDGAVLGKASVAFAQTIGGKQIQVEKNAMQLYTKNECDLLKGKYTSLNDQLRKEGALADEVSKALLANGENYGVCDVNGVPYSMICTVEEPATMSKDISDSAKKHLTTFLK